MSLGGQVHRRKRPERDDSICSFAVGFDGGLVLFHKSNMND